MSDDPAQGVAAMSARLEARGSPNHERLRDEALIRMAATPGTGFTQAYRSLRFTYV